MSHWNRKMQGVENKDVRFCHLCGAEVYQLRFANGDPYYTDVLDEGRGRFVIVGAGNNFNFKPQHDCTKSAENNLRNAESTYAEFYRNYEEARKAVRQMEADEIKTAQNNPEIDSNTRDLLKRIRESAESRFKSLSEQKAGIDNLLSQLRNRLESLRQGHPIIPEGKPAVGRTAKVVKGRKVPIGTTGKIVWMGLDGFKEDGIRVGIETEDKVRHYTSAENIEVIP